MVNTKVFSAFPTLETRRLILRELGSDDIDTLFELHSSSRVNQFIHNGREAKTRDEIVKHLESRKMFFEKGWGITWGVTLKTTQELVATFGFNTIDVPHHRGEVGGALSPKYWRSYTGANIIMETFSATLRFGFDELNLHSITARVAPANTVTIAILEKFGFRKEAHLVDRFFTGDGYEDQYIYSMIKGNKTFKHLLQTTLK